MITAILCLVYPIHVIAFDLQEEAQDKVQKDVISALVFSKIEEAVHNYYGQYFKNIPRTAPYFVDMLSVTGEKSAPYYVNFTSYKVKVQVSPYLGPHNPVGTDQITLTIGMSGEVRVERFEHIKSYELPWNYRDSAKGTWPPKE